MPSNGRVIARLPCRCGLCQGEGSADRMRAKSGPARTFIARGENAGAAHTLIPVGDIPPMQGRSEPAFTAYRMEENVARQAADPTLNARALKTQGQIESSQRDYRRGLAHAEEARAL